MSRSEKRARLRYCNINYDREKVLSHGPIDQCYKTFIYCHSIVKLPFCVIKQKFWGIYRDIWNNICSKWHLFKMTIVQNDICSKWHLFKMTIVQNDICSKWHLFKMTLVQNHICLKWHWFKMIFVWNDICSKRYLSLIFEKYMRRTSLQLIGERSNMFECID